ncbi:hypothetical protein G3I60_41075 [Streptomyces sp. SID13666]|uniref:hypothetical protein n=1 Tax=unclassified Streptomyces TaxID=2593676 RepID=UPI0013C1909B|nr:MULTISPECIES: hypothetical protein [unclassified Streptomyces]NEA60391.1 hypothetical protein [Streptomyces sp. SID13666]NEA76822.1 hypothetical protein [Streptomyces sp. SID13588]
MPSRPRPVYYEDYDQDFGLSGLTARVRSRVGLRIDAPTILALAAQETTQQEDLQLGADVRLLLGSPLPDHVLHAAWRAATGGCFDPTDEATGIRDWLLRLADLCPPENREPDSGQASDPVGHHPQISEEGTARGRAQRNRRTRAPATPRRPRS